MPDLLATDTLTVPLGIVCAIAFLLHTYLTPQSLVHPILLGRQADVERIRKPGESAIYRSYATGMMGQLPARPAAAVRTQLDLIKPELDNTRSLWSSKVTSTELSERVKALASGLVREAGLTPKESNVLLLLNDSFEFIIADFALSSISVPSFTLSSPTLLSSVLETHPPDAIFLHSFFVPRILELLADNNELRNHKLIVIGEDPLPREVQNLGVQVFSLSALEKHGKSAEPTDFPPPDPNDVYSVSFYEDQGEIKATQLTHENATAGVVATRVLLPLNGPFSPSDSLLSSHCLSTPLGRVIAYTAIYEGCNFATTKSTILYRKEDEIPSKDSELDDIGSLSPLPTVIFLSGEQLQAITSRILANAKKSFFMPLAWRHKVFALQHGNINNETLWDRVSFSDARKLVLGKADETIRAFIVSGGVESSTLTPARIALSLPLVNAHAHPLVAGPVFVSHPSDLQAFSAASTSDLARLAHVGPPSINIEVKLSGVHDEAVESGSDPVGEIHVRGPTVTRPLGEDNDRDGWIRTGDRAAVQPNGTFKVLRKA